MKKIYIYCFITTEKRDKIKIVPVFKGAVVPMVIYWEDVDKANIVLEHGVKLLLKSLNQQI